MITFIVKENERLFMVMYHVGDQRREEREKSEEKRE